MPPGKLVLDMAKKRPKAKAKTTTKKRKNGKEDDTSVSSQDNDTNTSKTSSKHNKNAPPEVQQQPSSAESDSSGEEEDDCSDDEPEIQEPPNKKLPERTTVSQKPIAEKKSNNSVMDKKDDDNTDNYGMFIDDAPIDNLPGNLKPFIKNVIDNKLFSTVKFISCPADAKNLMGLVFFEIKWHGNSMAQKQQRTLQWAARCEYITTRIVDLRQYAYDRWYHIYSRKY